jgi:hypothetical protein
MFLFGDMRAEMLAKALKKKLCNATASSPPSPPISGYTRPS